MMHRARLSRLFNYNFTSIFTLIISLTNIIQAADQLPKPIPSVSYISLDGLNLIINFDKPITLGPSLDAFAAHKTATGDSDPTIWLRTSHQIISASDTTDEHNLPFCQSDLKPTINNNDDAAEITNSLGSSPPSPASSTGVNNRAQTRDQLIQGIQLCAKLLTAKSLKILYKYKLYNCIWATKTQLIIQLKKPAKNQLRLAFQSTSLGAINELISNRRASLGVGRSSTENNNPNGQINEVISVQLSRLPLESLGVPLQPRLDVTGPNQVPICGKFTLSAHLWSPFGTEPNESVSLSWSVDRLTTLNRALINELNNSTSGSIDSEEASNLRWARLRELVSANKANNLILDAQLLDMSPQSYHFRLIATFTTSLKTITLNATHRVSRLDYETPIGSIYGTHLLSSQSGSLKTSRDILLLADVQIPECAGDIKQIGMYWQVSDQRVKFEQTYAPFYLAKAGSLPESSSLDFRLNLFYGIRLKRFSSANTQLITSDSQIESKISGGLLAVSVVANLNRDDAPGSDHSDDDNYLQFYGYQPSQLGDKDVFNYQWSCFDGKSALSCTRSKRLGHLGSSSNNNSINSFDLTSPNRVLSVPAPINGELMPPGSLAGGNSGTNGIPLIEKSKQNEPMLKLPLEWLEPGSQLWFGLQRSRPSGAQSASSSTSRSLSSSSSSQTEYALVQVGEPLPTTTSKLSIGPILVGNFRTQLSVRNPLTGALILPSGTPIVILGRASPVNSIKSIRWESPNYLYPLRWIQRNETNPLTGSTEIVSELHLNPNLIVPNAHYQFQLAACLNSGISTSVSLNVDFMTGVNQCRVEVSQSKQSNSLVVSIDYCNIPLDLSPITYQIYAAETAELSTFSDNPNSADHEQQSPPLNVMDELELESQMQPITSAQLSPSFHISHSMATALLSNDLLNNHSEQPRLLTDQIVARFAARVCDRIQSCHWFFSNPFHLKRSNTTTSPDSTNLSEPNLSSSPTSARLQLIEQQENQVKLTQSLRNMIETARKTNLGGNSIAAIGTLSGAIDLAQKLNSSSVGSSQKIRELYQASIRDILLFSSLSLQRHFQFTDSGQANLVIHTLAKILSLPSSIPLEAKFKTVRLLGQITKRTIDDQLKLKQKCVPDIRSLQAAYESLLNSFNYYSLFGISKQATEKHHNKNHSTINDSPPLANRLLLIIPNSQLPSSIYQPVDNSINLNSTSNQASINKNQPFHQRLTGGNLTENESNGSKVNTLFAMAWNKRRNDELLQTYLRLIRMAMRSIISASAIQVPLGGQVLLYYVYNGQSQPSNIITSSANNKNNNNENQPESSNSLPIPVRNSFMRSAYLKDRRSASSNPLIMAASTDSSKLINNNPASSDIVTSLRHLSALPSDNIEIDLHQFGSIAIKLSPRIIEKFNLLQKTGYKCVNDTSNTITAQCSSFILSISSYGGKSTHRSLDEGNSLEVPIVDINLLSTMDGSNLIHVMDNPLWATESETIVTFFLPDVDSNLSPESSSVNYESPTPTTSDSLNRKVFKCYQFNEDENEWVYISEPGPLDQDSKRINCRFRGLGTFAAFSGQLPPIESGLNSPLVIGVAGFGAFVIFLSILGCLATEWKHSKRSRARQNSESNIDSTTASEGDQTSEDYGEEITRSARDPPTPRDHHLYEQTNNVISNSSNRRNVLDYPLR